MFVPLYIFCIILTYFTFRQKDLILKAIFEDPSRKKEFISTLDIPMLESEDEENKENKESLEDASYSTIQNLLQTKKKESLTFDVFKSRFILPINSQDIPVLCSNISFSNLLQSVCQCSSSTP
jgi:hypothetical protein